MVCKVDNEKVFEDEHFYTVKCEACQKYCKIYHYRSCEERHQWNQDSGIDVFSTIKHLDQMARTQLGIAPSQDKNKQNSQKKKISRHRGR